jgi:hypothetical protein
VIYCDTSLVVAGLSSEPMTELVQIWLADQEADSLCISPWVVTEFSSAVSLKVRRGDLDPAGKAQMLSSWQQVQQDHLIWGSERAMPCTLRLLRLAGTVWRRSTSNSLQPRWLWEWRLLGHPEC